MKQITKITIAVVFTMAQIQSLSAQTPGFDDDVQDVPVNQGIIPMLIIGIFLIYFLKSKPSQF
jgi:hypothetical protein